MRNILDHNAEYYTQEEQEVYNHGHQDGKNEGYLFGVLNGSLITLIFIGLIIIYIDEIIPFFQQF